MKMCDTCSASRDRHGRVPCHVLPESLVPQSVPVSLSLRFRCFDIKIVAGGQISLFGGGFHKDTEELELWIDLAGPGAKKPDPEFPGRDKIDDVRGKWSALACRVRMGSRLPYSSRDPASAGLLLPGRVLGLVFSLVLGLVICRMLCV